MFDDRIVLVASAAAAAALLGYARWKRSSSQQPAWEHFTCRMPAKVAADERRRLQAEISLTDRTGYFAVSCCPITHAAEQRMEQISTVVSKENYNDHWDAGSYSCANCGHVLYDSEAKFVGPCMWPSFRRPHLNGLLTIAVAPGSYNKYTCEVHELYCAKCHLFLGHQFFDGVACGDTHPEAGWRHCVLSLSMKFSPKGS